VISILAMVLPPPGLHTPCGLGGLFGNDTNAPYVKVCTLRDIEPNLPLNDADAAAGEGTGAMSPHGRASARTRARADLRAKARARRREAAAVVTSRSGVEAAERRSEDDYSENAGSCDGDSNNASPKSFGQESDEIAILRYKLSEALSLCESQKVEIATLKSQNSFLLSEWQAAKESKQVPHVTEHCEERFGARQSESHLARATYQSAEEGRSFADHGFMIQNLIQPLVFSCGQTPQSLMPMMPPPPSTPPPLLAALTERTPSPCLQTFPTQPSDVDLSSSDLARLPLPVKVPLRTLESVGTWESSFGRGRGYHPL
jgi:hypothetical protein